MARNARQQKPVRGVQKAPPKPITNAVVVKGGASANGVVHMGQAKLVPPPRAPLVAPVAQVVPPQKEQKPPSPIKAAPKQKSWLPSLFGGRKKAQKPVPKQPVPVPAELPMKTPQRHPGIPVQAQHIPFVEAGVVPDTKAIPVTTKAPLHQNTSTFPQTSTLNSGIANAQPQVYQELQHNKPPPRIAPYVITRPIEQNRAVLRPKLVHRTKKPGLFTRLWNSFKSVFGFGKKKKKQSKVQNRTTGQLGLQTPNQNQSQNKFAENHRGVQR